MTQKQNGVLEWLQSCETPAPSEPKIKAVIVAGKSYMNSSEFNKNSMRDIILNQLQFLPLSFWIVQIIDRKSTRLNSSHPSRSRMPSSA